MARLTVFKAGALPPEAWPAWVLGPRGTTSLDPVRAAVLRSEFHQWMRDRDAWFVDNGIAYSWHACSNERRRRGDAWQALHPSADRDLPSRQGLTLNLTSSL